MTPLTPADSFGQDVISQWPHLVERFLFRNANCNSLVKRDVTLGRKAIESANVATFITNHIRGCGAFWGGMEGSMGAEQHSFGLRDLHGSGMERVSQVRRGRRVRGIVWLRAETLKTSLD